MRAEDLYKNIIIAREKIMKSTGLYPKLMRVTRPVYDEMQPVNLKNITIEIVELDGSITTVKFK
jgi:hypothetical protein